MMDSAQTIDWPELARALRSSLSVSPIHPGVTDQLRVADPLVIACSGGADSVFLACILWAEWPPGIARKRLKIAHYNHRWRGRAADEDAAFVEALAEGLGLDYRQASRPEDAGAFTETAARALRLEFLRDTAAAFGAGHIAFGHQLDDILETQLLRIVRGSGADGLAAPRPVSRFADQAVHLRPVLGLRAGDIRMALKDCGVPWREDASNRDEAVPRNALRQRIIPDLAEALGRDPGAGAARSRQLLEEDADALDQITRERIPEAFEAAEQLSRSGLRALPKALRRRALCAWLSGHGLLSSVGAQALDLLVEALGSERKRHRVSAGTSFILFDGQSVRIESAAAADGEGDSLAPTRVAPGEAVFLSSGAVFEVARVDVDEALRQRLSAGEVNPAVEAWIDAGGDRCLRLRAWEPGDRYHPLGAAGSKKLGACFIDRQIPRVERSRLPVVLSETGEIIWVPGLAPADGRKILRQSKKALRLTYHPSPAV
jgi:tRNA(Ile)-lysidine synthase